MSGELLARSRNGDQEAFRELTDPCRRELQVHCYRFLGSMHDAEDALQETLLAAWRGLGRFEQRSSLRAWLYRIATNRCLDSVRAAGHRPPLTQDPSFALPEPTRFTEPPWLDPLPDTFLDSVPDAAPGPDARYESRESVELAFIAALQHLPPRQRAALILRDVLGFRAAEVANMLDSSEDSVKSALRRAREALEQGRAGQDRERAPAANSSQERELVQRFADAFEADDIGAIVALLTNDALLTMPPAPLEYEGPAAIESFLRYAQTWREGRRTRLVPTRANAQPAFGFYLQDPDMPISHGLGLIVLTLEGDRISGLTRFTDESALATFGLPETLADD